MKVYVIVQSNSSGPLDKEDSDSEWLLRNSGSLPASLILVQFLAHVLSYL